MTQQLELDLESPLSKSIESGKSTNTSNTTKGVVIPFRKPPTSPEQHSEYSTDVVVQADLEIVRLFM